MYIDKEKHASLERNCSSIGRAKLLLRRHSHAAQRELRPPNLEILI